MAESGSARREEQGALPHANRMRYERMDFGSERPRQARLTATDPVVAALRYLVPGSRSMRRRLQAGQSAISSRSVFSNAVTQRSRIKTCFRVDVCGVAARGAYELSDATRSDALCAERALITVAFPLSPVPMMRQFLDVVNQAV